MVSPEPDFWIHAVRGVLALLLYNLVSHCSLVQGVELAKTPRPPTSNDKDKGKGKGREKVDTRTKKGGEEQGKETPTVYDFHDGSINSLAVRCSLLCGYERFKVRSTVVISCWDPEERISFTAHTWFFYSHPLHVGERSTGTAT
jgi:hypothetical protein